MFKKLIFLFLVSGQLAGASIQSYAELTSLVTAGIPVTIVSDLQVCTQQSNMPKGYFIPSSLMLVPASGSQREHVTTSDLHFSERKGEPVYEFVKYTFTSDNVVEIYLRFYNPQTFAPIDSPRTIRCKLGAGIQVLY